MIGVVFINLFVVLYAMSEVKCAWVKGQACRYPRIGKRLKEDEGFLARVEDLLACVACLVGWHLKEHLELSELKKREMNEMSLQEGTVNWLHVRGAVICPKSKEFILLEVCQTCKHHEETLVSHGVEHVICKYKVKDE